MREEKLPNPPLVNSLKKQTIVSGKERLLHGRQTRLRNLLRTVCQQYTWEVTYRAVDLEDLCAGLEPR